MTADATDLDIVCLWQRFSAAERDALMEELPDDELAVLAAALEAEGVEP
jgi:hypothetical protein